MHDAAFFSRSPHAPLKLMGFIINSDTDRYLFWVASSRGHKQCTSCELACLTKIETNPRCLFSALANTRLVKGCFSQCWFSGSSGAFCISFIMRCWVLITRCGFFSSGFPHVLPARVEVVVLGLLQAIVQICEGVRLGRKRSHDGAKKTGYTNHWQNHFRLRHWAL